LFFELFATGVGHIERLTALPNSLPLGPARRAFGTHIPCGVGHNPDPISSVRRTNGGSWYAVPFRIKPERGQVSENTLKSPSKQSCDVLHDDVAGSYLANNSGVLRP